MKLPAIILLLAASAVAQTSTSAGLAALQAAHAADYQQRVTVPHEAAVMTLNTSYTAALDRALASATQSAQLDTAVALREEKKRVAEHGPLPPDDAAAPDALIALRRTYRSSLASLELKRAQAAAPVKAQYDKALEALQNALDKGW